MAFDPKTYITDSTATFTDVADFAAWLCEQGFVDYTAVRNYAIREHYHDQKTADRLQAKINTADKFALSVEYVHRVLYDKRYRKSSNK